MALMIIDASGRNRQRMRCLESRGRGLRVKGEFVEEQEGLWRS